MRAPYGHCYSDSTKSWKGWGSLPWAQLRVIFARSAPARYHLLPIDAEHELVRVVTVAQKNHSANKYENAPFHPLPLFLPFELTYEMGFENIDPLYSASPNPKENMALDSP